VAIDVAPIEFERADIERWTEELRTIGNRAAAKPRAVGEVRVKWFMSMASAFYAYCLDDPASGCRPQPGPEEAAEGSTTSPPSSTSPANR
jgi:hypothetical protein